MGYPTTPMKDRSEEVDIGRMLVPNFRTASYSPKIQKLFGIHRQVKKKPSKPVYPMFELAYGPAAYGNFLKSDNPKVFTEFIKSGKKMIIYFGDHDGTAHVGVLADFINYAWGKDAVEKFHNVPWEIKTKANYVTKIWRNIRAGVVERSGHLVSWDKPKATFYLVKNALEEDNQGKD